MKIPDSRIPQLLPVLLALFVIGISPTTTAQYKDSARYAFAVSPSEKTVQVLDSHKQELAGTIELETTPDSVIASETLKALIVPHAADRSLTLIDLLSKELTQITYSLDIAPDGVYLSPLGDTLAIYDATALVLEVHALKRNDILLRAENIHSSTGFTFNLDGSKLFWTDPSTGELASLDLWSNKAVLSIAKPNSTVSALTRSTDGRLGFISIKDRNAVAVVNLQSMQLVAEVPVGIGPGRPWGTADGQYMLVPNADGSVSTISTFSLTTLYTVPGVEEPVSINSGWLDSVAAVIGRHGEIVFFDISSGTHLGSNQLGKNARPGLVSSDSKTLTVSSAGTVSFFEMRRQSMLAQIDNLPGDLSPVSLAVSNNLCH